ncbi:DUF6197 family protein [Burkholderia gladioli]|uniref:DUF6197 family protein n=1 Tax=Burkholderia gladioli TaxID=28095 RepID=UPI0016405128|nr:hypothetical protein [Burkholderia gladioli]
MTDPNTTALTVQQRAALKWAIEVAHGHSVKEFVEPLRALLTSPRAAGAYPQRANYVRSILNEAREITIRGWTRGASARDNKGQRCNPNSVNIAAAWSAFGAFQVAEANVLNRLGNLDFGRKEAVSEAVYSATRQAMIAFADATGIESGCAQKRIEAWNDVDDRSGIEVISMFERLIADIDAAPAAPVAEPIRLVHIAVAEDGGKLRWMTGRKPRDCELYMMPDGGRAPAVVYAALGAPVAEQKRDDTGRLTSDYEPTAHEIQVAREAIRREFGNNGTDGYYIRILKAIHGAMPKVDADGAPADEPSEVEQVIACLGDDAAKLREANPDDEMADNMEAAARLLSERAALSPAPVDEAAQDEQALLDEALSNHGYGHASVDGRERHHFKKGFKARAAVSPATARKSCMCSGLGPCERRTDGSCRVAAPTDAPDAATFIREVAAQKPEKPDYWSSCGQCQRNAERAQDLLDAACAQSIDLPDSEGGEA